MLTRTARHEVPQRAADGLSSPAPPPARLVGLLGPAIVAGVAYLDPGNVATNMTAGARFGFLLVWVVVLANLIAWLVQYLSAKLGLATGRSLAELLGDRTHSAGARRLYWVQAELVAMATDVAEVIGGAVALALLFDLPLIIGGCVTATVSLGLLLIHGTGRQLTFERMIAGLMVIIVLGFTVGLFIDPAPAGDVVGGLVPRLDGPESLLLASSILGATVMPHAIYAHSALTRDRFAGLLGTAAPIRRLLRATRWDVTIALTVAGGVNLAMLVFAADTLRSVPGTDSLQGAHAAITQEIGPMVATAFAIGLLASGLASSAVGAYAGSEIIRGLLRVRVSVLVRRTVTVLPALVILSAGIEPTAALIGSQVVLSFGIPFALAPLMWMTARRSIMGNLVNRRLTTILGIVSACFLITLNVALLVLTAAR